jgi:glucose-1-phosphate cytidylyltransferase
MKVVILAGGLGTRLAEETEIKPKPMIEIGGRPILWHIMKHYAHFGFKQFFIALGYKGEAIKRYFIDYYSLNGSLTINFSTGAVKTQNKECEDWIVNLIDTGSETNTGGRIKRLKNCLKDDSFMVTYGDGVCDVDLHELLDFHRTHKRIATVTAVRPPARFGGLVFNGDMVVTEFTEKPQIGEGWINGGFMVFEPQIFEYLTGDESSMEADALARWAEDQQVAGYRQINFWLCMETLRYKRLLENLWHAKEAPWKVW